MTQQATNSDSRHRKFRPGFRLSVIDVIVLIFATAGAILTWPYVWWIGFCLLFVVLHFFLFCNVFRIARVPELIWAAAFLALSTATILSDRPGWIMTTVCCLILSVFLIIRSVRAPSYHGICWQRWNPNLPAWWEQHVNASNNRN